MSKARSRASAWKAIAVAAIMGAHAAPVAADEPWRDDRFYLQYGFYTVHYDPDPDHDNTPNLVNFEWRTKHRWLDGQVITGLALFDNSFGQFSQYAYGGVLWRPLEDHQPFYVKVSAGVLHGYKYPYEDKVPLNSNGWSPGAVASFGYCHTRYCGEIVILGAAALTFTVGVTLP